MEPERGLRFLKRILEIARDDQPDHARKLSQINDVVTDMLLSSSIGAAGLPDNLGSLFRTMRGEDAKVATDLALEVVTELIFLRQFPKTNNALKVGCVDFLERKFILMNWYFLNLDPNDPWVGHRIANTHFFEGPLGYMDYKLSTLVKGSPISKEKIFSLILEQIEESKIHFSRKRESLQLASDEREISLVEVRSQLTEADVDLPENISVSVLSNSKLQKYVFSKTKFLSFLLSEKPYLDEERQVLICNFDQEDITGIAYRDDENLASPKTYRDAYKNRRFSNFTAIFLKRMLKHAIEQGSSKGEFDCKMIAEFEEKLDNQRKYLINFLDQCNLGAVTISKRAAQEKNEFTKLSYCFNVPIIAIKTMSEIK